MDRVDKKFKMDGQAVNMLSPTHMMGGQYMMQSNYPPQMMMNPNRNIPRGYPPTTSQMAEEAHFSDEEPNQPYEHQIPPELQRQDKLRNIRDFLLMQKKTGPPIP
jgi:hypothetical protein